MPVPITADIGCQLTD